MDKTLLPIRIAFVLICAAWAIVTGYTSITAIVKAELFPTNVRALGVDLLSLSAHKFNGPKGAGALWVRRGVRMQSFMTGGKQERGRRAGTENVAGIAGFGVAARLADADLARSNEIKALRDDLEVRLQHIAPGLSLFGAGAERLPNTSCFALAGVAAETQVIALDLAGIAVSAGAACSSGKVGASHVLRAMGVPEATAGSAIRVSLGWNSQRSDIDRFVSAWFDLIDRRRRRDSIRPERLQHQEIGRAHV